METPKLTKKQQKQTLSAKKAKKETVRNVLATPYIKYWPILIENDAKIIQDVLNNNLMTFRETKVNIPWKELKNIPREERKTFRQKFTNTKLLNEDKKVDIVFGVNEVTCLLESNEAQLVLITSDVEPQLMVKHVINLAVLKKVPILVVPDLRNILKSKTGIASVAIAIKKKLSSEEFTRISGVCKKVFENYPVPPTHINYNRQEENPTDLIGEEKRNKTKQVLFSTNSKLSKENESEKQEKSTQFHLLRKNKTERSFIPELSISGDNSQKRLNKLQDSADFLSFGTKEINAGLKTYKSLKIKRIKNNSNRSKKKIEMLQKKK